MKTIRLLYPDWVSGGLPEYYFGGRLLERIVPPNPAQPLIPVSAPDPACTDPAVEEGISGKREILSSLADASQKILDQAPDRIITLGGTCLVSLAPFDYLHGRYPDAGILWIDAHPDVSVPEDGYPYAHAMVLGALLGQKGNPLGSMMNHPPFSADSILYLGLQGLLPYQKAFLDQAGVQYALQDQNFLSDQTVLNFLKRHPHTLIHFDIDVLDPKMFHSTYFAREDAGGDGSGSGRMSLSALSRYFSLISSHASIEGLTIAEYLPFDEYRLRQALEQLSIFQDS